MTRKQKAPARAPAPAPTPASTPAHDPAGVSLLLLGAPLRARSCGACKACCTQVPVELRPGTIKKANERCPHLYRHGCNIYATRPTPCRLWSCRWLFDPYAAGLKRPDIGGYIVDPWPDQIVADDRPVEVLQIWVDPARRHAHRDPGLRDFLAGYAERQRMPAMVRYSSQEGFLLVAPCMTASREWLELDSNMVTADEIAAKVRAAYKGA